MKLTEIIQELVKSLANRGDLEISAIVVKTSQNEVILEIPGIPENNPTQPPPPGSGFVISAHWPTSAEKVALDDYYKEFLDYLPDLCPEPEVRVKPEKEAAKTMHLKPGDNIFRVTPCPEDKESKYKPDDPYKYYHDEYRGSFASQVEDLERRLEANKQNEKQAEPVKTEVKAKARINMVTSYETLAQIHYLYSRPVELNTESSVATVIAVTTENGYPNPYEIPKNGRFELSAL